MNRRAKIVATIGPSSKTQAMIEQLIDAGMDVARLNFSHGSHEEHATIYKNLRDSSRKLNRSITILQDLQGPKMRVGEIENGQRELKTGQKITLSARPGQEDKNVIPVDFPQITLCARTGSRILLDDGNLELKVLSVRDELVDTQVTLGGLLKSHKGINLPGEQLVVPGFTDKDREDLHFGLDLGVDAIALSFVRSAYDILQVRQAIAEYNDKEQNIPIIAKLERPEALEQLDEIVHVSDGVMVARGDLGVEMSPETVPIAQKRIIDTANRHAKVVITATQMLDSMIYNPRPTRAEASDVANAIFDGTDAVMLSGETASGKYPVEAVKMMDAIICQAEENMSKWGRCQDVLLSEAAEDDTYFMTQAARALAHDRNVAGIAVFTKSGRTALMMSKARPAIPILAFTPDVAAFQRINLMWGVTPNLVPQVETIEAMLQVVEQAMLTSTSIQPGQQVVLICGYPIHAVRPTNLALLHTVGTV